VVELIEQRLMMVDMKQKSTVLINILKDKSVSRALVFTRTKHGANKLVRLLGRAGIGALGIHGNKAQTARTKAMDDFKTGRIRVLVATDIAARGIDVEDISHVINHDIPNVAETYVHRIGRTARAGCRGISISLCGPEEREFVRDIEKLIRLPIPVVSERPYMTSVVLGPEERPIRPQPRRQRPHDPARQRPDGNRSGSDQRRGSGRPGRRERMGSRNSRGY